MLPDTTTLNIWAAGWSTLMVAMLWQSALLAAAVGLVASLLRRASPAVRYWLWQIVAAKLLLMPLWSLSVPLAWLPTGSEATPTARSVPRTFAPVSPSSSDAAKMGAEPWTSDPPHANSHVEPAPLPIRFSWTAWMMVAWGVIVVVQLGLLFRQRARLGRLLARATLGNSALESLVADCAARLTLARIPRVLVVDQECSPFVCGVWRPVIVLPRSLEPLLFDRQLAPVLVHELAHVKRWDLLWNWIPQIARMLYFFHPVAHFVAFRIRLESELACDGWAMSATGQAASGYADLLVRVVGRLSEPAMLHAGSATAAGLDGHGKVHAKD